MESRDSRREAYDRRNVLLLDDDETLMQLLKSFFEQRGWVADCAKTAQEGFQKVAQHAYDLILCDYMLPDSDGLSIFPEVRRRSPLTKLAVITGINDMAVAASVLRMGAADLIPKPFTLAELDERLRALMTGRSASDDAGSLPPHSEDWPAYIVGESPAIKKVLRLIKKVAVKDPAVMITGESGTGKELVARAIHDLSRRRNGPFVAVNCGAIPDTLLEDEFFGHVKGAYTDARFSRIGKFEETDGGTLFLDEIGEMKPPLQVKLLRVLEERKFQRLGSNQTVATNFRLISATNADLAKKIAEGEFRADLFYRLNVVPIHNPPLRERKSDLPLLAQHILEMLAQQYKDKPKQVAPDSLRLLCSYDWPGNVRELRNLLELAHILAGDREEVLPEDFPSLNEQASRTATENEISRLLTLPAEGINLDQVVNSVERNLICQSLRRTGGNKNKAARLLYLKRTTLVEKLKRMDLLEEFGN
ncbi:MAG: sigma-54-dependent transcriptional regulator [Acidobacteriota bacterium]